MLQVSSCASICARSRTKQVPFLLTKKENDQFSGLIKYYFGFWLQIDINKMFN